MWRLPFFDRRSDEERAADDERARRDAASLESLRAGGLPTRAMERLTTTDRAGGAVWTSNLSANDALGLGQLGFEPLEHVLGACVFHLPYNAYKTGQWSSGDVQFLSQGMYAARDLAIGRMAQEAELLGAHGIVDVKIEEKAYEWGSDLIDVIANGTAVRLRGGPRLPHPFICNMPAEKVLALLAVGYMPVRLALGFCAYYQVTSWNDERVLRSWRGSSGNQEMRAFTHATNQARHIGMQRMQQDARAHGAEGIVGSEMGFHVHEIGVYRTPPWSNDSERIEDHLVRFTALGTGLAPVRNARPMTAPRLTISLDASPRRSRTRTARTG